MVQKHWETKKLAPLVEGLITLSLENLQGYKNHLLLYFSKILRPILSTNFPKCSKIKQTTFSIFYFCFTILKKNEIPKKQEHAKKFHRDIPSAIKLYVSHFFKSGGTLGTQSIRPDIIHKISLSFCPNPTRSSFTNLLKKSQKKVSEMLS